MTNKKGERSNSISIIHHHGFYFRHEVLQRNNYNSVSLSLYHVDINKKKKKRKEKGTLPSKESAPDGI